MQIGQYDVVANVTGSHEGGFKVGVTRKRVEGCALKELTHTLDDRIHSTMEQACDHAYEYARRQVKEGFWCLGLANPARCAVRIGQRESAL